MMNLLKPVKALLFSIALVSVVKQPALAEVPTYTNPYTMMEVVADKAFNRIKQDQALIAENKEHLRTIVIEELLPYIDSRYAAGTVVGRTVDIRQQPEVFAEFVKAFEQYMVQSYAGALTYYRDQQVIIEPERPIENQNIITIRTRVIDPGKPDITIDFKLRRNRSTEQWLVIDMVAEGISLLDSKRAELSNLIRQQGLASVTALLIEKSKDPIVVPE
ncbi:ABC transporter substrate-binding protein [Arsukibacterium sp.]|uniref:ABC transporter substrate-binding protein n=1 Tax=Arsukibacterium sp. TaxID=1977258 RepID=UPI002FD93DBD